MKMDLIIQKWKRIEIDRFLSKQIQNIFEYSFPLSERDDFSLIASEIARGEKILYTVQKQDRILGFSIVQIIWHDQIPFLLYMAIAQETRNQGIGGLLLDYIVTDCKQNKKAIGLLFEVENPDKTTNIECEIRKRRINFYRRHGAEIVPDGGVYQMPNLNGQGSIRMRVMWLPFKPDIGLPMNVQNLYKLIFAEIYNRNENDPLLKSILNNLIKSD